MSKKRIQSLLINYLMKQGQIELLLPDGVKLEIGVLQEDKKGKLINCIEDYCYVTVTREDKQFLLDSYNMGLKFSEDPRTMILDEISINEEGEAIRNLEVI